MRTRITHSSLADRHASTSGVAHFACDNERQAIALCNKLLGFLPSNNLEAPPRQACTDPIDREDPRLGEIVPYDPSKPYDMHEVIDAVVDDSDLFEVHEAWAQNMICGFARLDGRPCGIVANQPAVLAGCLDIDASIKAARFVRFCDCFNIPLVTFVDVPGFLPGTTQEYGGIIRHGAKLLYAFAEATVPKVTLITRKAYGGAYDVMSSKHIRADFNFAWPSAEIAVMGPDGAVSIVYREEMAKADDPEAVKREYAEKYRDLFSNPFKAAELGYIDAVIAPEQTRARLVAALEVLQSKRDSNPPKKHGNIPL